MGKLYLVTGPAGVGKSTISSKIASSLEKSVLLEGDDFYHQVVGGYVQAWKEGNHLDVFFKVVISTIKIYLENGYDVIFNYILDKEDLSLFKKEIDDDIKLAVLLVSGDILMERDKERSEDCRMNERCLVLLNDFLEEGYEDKYIINTDNISIEEITNEIISSDRFLVK